jgi:hypothetical protein
MVWRMIVRFLVALAIAWVAGTVPARAQTQGQRAEMVVELYTSQGCTQCPRANRLLGIFSRDDNVLALTFPVGIWDYLGWHDTFAQPEFADRQRAYSQAMRVRGRFTPQLVVNGARTISASDWDEARAIYDAQKRAGWPANAPDVSLSVFRNGRARATVGSGAAGSNAEIWLLAYDPGPLTVVITGGVNRNRSVPHYNLVKWIERVGTWNGAAVWHERPRCQPECAIIVQEPNGGRILAAAFTSRPSRY